MSNIKKANSSITTLAITLKTGLLAIWAFIAFRLKSPLFFVSMSSPGVLHGNQCCAGRCEYLFQYFLFLYPSNQIIHFSIFILKALKN